jgi:hypothetical protein
MKQKDKELLLKDLCVRLPYNVKCKVHLDTKGYCLRDEDKYCDDTLESVNCKKQTCTFNKSIGYNFGYFSIEDVKPYLRPLTSMTEEEKKELGRISCEGNIEHKYGIFYRSQDYLNSIHVDYRGLIEKGLALVAPEGMYNIK